MIIFIILITNLFLAILLTICTDPGQIPQDREFDHPEDDLVNK